MMFLASITIMMAIVIVTVSVNIHLYDDGFLDPNNFLIILPVEVYSKDLFIIAAVLNLVSAGFFILPVL
jgi:hypothetical protein